MDELNRFYRDTWVEVNLDAIETNVKSIKNTLASNVKIMAVVKANGYGHGAFHVAKIALESGAEYLGVAILDEALALRKQGIMAPILVLGWIRPSDINVAAEHDITLTLFQKEWLVEAEHHYKSNKNVQFHLKIDTGMGRIGIRTKNEGKDVIDYLNQKPYYRLEGVYTHFATADEKNLDYFEMQYQRFLTALSWLNEWGVELSHVHCGNSATTIRFPERIFTMVRVGIAMYGLVPSKEIKDEIPFRLEEAFSFHSRVAHIKKVEANEGISYGATYKTTEDEWIATIPVGYADGWIRKHGLTGHVLINGKQAPIVGRVCMDQMMVKVCEKVNIGTKVTLIGNQGEIKISSDDIAERLDTINYEVPLMISSRVPRVILKNRKIVTINNEVY